MRIVARELMVQRGLR